VILTPLRDEQGTLVGFGKVTRDLTARRQAEAAERGLLREQAARVAAENVAIRAAEANRIKDEFLATVSHELRTPLNAIVGWASMLRQRQLEPNIAKGVDVIHRNALAQLKIVEDILDVSRIVTGKLHLEPVPIDLVAVVHEAIESVRYSASARLISMVFEPGVEMCPLVGDPDRLRQAVWNVLSNAVKFTPSGGSIRVALEQRGQEVTLTFVDTGQGIEPDFLPFVFDRFKQADASTTRRFGGLGLGLALVRHIIELHGGSVGVASEGAGKGSTFFLNLPVRATMPSAPSPPSTPVKVPRSPRETRPLHGLRILLVDDDVDANELMAEVIAAAGATVEIASSAASGFDTLRRFRPHILVSDIGMPEEDGYSLLRRIRALDPSEGGGIPSIALTAYTRSEDRTKALAAGFTTHVGKPVNPDDVVAAIVNLASFVRH
jgi:signal transduction histidine kinase